MKIAVVIAALDEAEGITSAIESARSGPQASPRTRAERSGGESAEPESGGGQPAAPAVDPPLAPPARSEDRRRIGRRGACADEVASAMEVEIVVVDGGSRDATRERAGAAGARVIQVERGRAQQLQAGFEATEGDPVLFLHADTRLPKDWAEAVSRALRDPSVVGGAFRFGFDRTTLGLRLVEWGARFRVALFGLPYGDQGIFARRRVLEEIGGVPQVPLMEDLDLVKALKGRGRLARLPLVARTSARRHVAGGVLATALRHSAAALAWRFGVDRRRIARFVGRSS